MGTTNVKRSKSNGAKAAPLLPTTDQRESGPCDTCSRGIFLLVPIVACSLVLVALFLLAYRTGNGVRIAETSISLCLASYDPKAEVLLVISCGATLMFVVSIMRNIQINVYHRRQKSESRALRGVNFIAALSNILAYCGFILLAMFDINYLYDGARLLHYIGAYMYFSCAGLYEVLHTFLLWKQSQYPMLQKVIFTVVGVSSIASAAIFASNIENFYEFEWLAIALHAIYVGLMSTLFLVDPVDDELRDFFCCRRRGQRDQLPDGWKSATDQSSGDVYYYHTSGETTWKKPNTDGNIKKFKAGSCARVATH